MGTFSWLKADGLTQVENLVSGKPFKFLIPLKFGGGYIKDCYQGYGNLGTKEDGTEKYDMYELLAFWNADRIVPSGEYAVKEILRYDGNLFPYMKEIDRHTNHNRNIGIDIGCYDSQIDRLQYPLKIVSASYIGTYESCDGRSYRDPNQGLAPLRRSER